MTDVPRRRPRIALACALLLAGLAAGPAAAADDNAADAALRAIYDAEWAWRREQADDEDPNADVQPDRLPRVDAATQQRRLAYWTTVLERLDAIDVAALSAEERINARIFRTLVEAQANDIRFRTYEAPFTANNFFWASIVPRAGITDAAGYRRQIARMRDVPRYFDEQIANMRAGLDRGFSLPKVVLDGRDATVVPFTVAGEDNPLYAPFRRMPAQIPEAEQRQLRAEAMAAIGDAAVPAYRTLLAFLREEYVPRARTTLGASELPDGAAYYQAMLRKFTTLDMTPAQIHQVGLDEMARIRGEMDAIIRQVGFRGSFAQFLEFLRTDPQFYATTPDELLGRASLVVMRANGQLRHVIGTLPRYRHGLVAIPAEIAATNTGGRGGLQNCMFNTYNLPARPLYTLPALALHECTPGHSFQFALALEAPARPPFRQQAKFSGYIEGWGLYTEWLGVQMGIYQTPYEDFGRLTYEAWRAARLVIDTGIHAFGWSRERAIAYLRDNTALAEHEIVTEVDRYIGQPGQAAAYKLGELQIRRHRAEAEAALGPRFDQRAFHDALLAIGPVPLPVLEESMKRFIEDQRVAPAR
ncbi:MAG: DUF885 family protein [Proteobacteria bacterium]|nr:DUF885 family protein [Pseudomonadota bacterium]